MSLARPPLTVIIPTRNRNHLLQNVLVGLTQQTLRPDDFSVVVVDDASDVPAEQCSQFFPTARFIRLDVHHGRAKARNAGLAHATGDRVLFLDDDMLPHPHLLQAHLDAGGRGDVVVGYRYEQTSSSSGTNEFHSTNGNLSTDPRDDAYSRSGDDLSRWTSPWYVCQSNNLSVSRKFAMHVCGFDEAFIGWGIEDLEFGYRLQHAGATFALSRRAVCYHQAHPRNRSEEHSSHQINLQTFLQKHRSYDIELWSAIKHHKLPPDTYFPDLVAQIEQILSDWQPDWVALSALPPLPKPAAMFGSGTHLRSTEAWSLFHPSLVARQDPVGFLGVDLPIPANTFASVVISSMALSLPRVLFSSMIDEARRLATGVFLCAPPQKAHLAVEIVRSAGRALERLDSSALFRIGGGT